MAQKRVREPLYVRSMETWGVFRKGDKAPLFTAPTRARAIDIALDHTDEVNVLNEADKVVLKWVWGKEQGGDA